MGVGRGHVAPGTKQSNTKKAIREFKKWDSDRYPLYNSDNEEFTCEGERFVPAYDYHNQRVDKKYYVSDKGNVLSFVFFGTDKPIVMKQSPDKRGYMLCGNSWRVHKLVWFSFAADALENGTDFPDFYGVDIKTMKDLKKMARAIKENEKKGIDEGEEIHHMDKNPKNNSIANLQCDADKMHDLIHALDKMESDDERMQKIVETPDAFVQDNATIIFADEKGVSAHEVSLDELMEHSSDTVKSQLEAMMQGEWIKRSNEAVRMILEDIGYDFFGRPFSVDIIVKGLRQRCVVTREKTGLYGVSIVTDHKLVNDDPDAIVNYDTGEYDLPKYIFD